RHEVSDKITVTQGTFDGVQRDQLTHTVHVPPNASMAVLRWDAGQLDRGPDRYLSVHAANDLFPPNRHFFAAIKDLVREPQPLVVEMTQVDTQTLDVTLRADAAYAYFVHLIVPHEATRFSDNYFDLIPGEERSIRVSNAEVELKPDMVTVKAR
ncbi:MAG: glycoside hydrolase family 2 protein, partial [Chloroflexi bacterium]|nr:glycoside hydrolase family 2 protein [Chloroflexota bacterium]